MRRQRGSWISPALARARSERIHALDYHLDLRIDATGRKLEGRQRIKFELNERGVSQLLVLDWRPEVDRSAIERALQSLRVNGLVPSRSSVRVAGGHLLIGAQLLEPGPNRIELQWEARTGDAGKALTRYRDPLDGGVYVYTLFVPADASTVFPCFDQPDLKGRFALTLTVPAGWNAIANAPVGREQKDKRSRRLQFRLTAPISTYAFAFAAGVFVAIRSRHAAQMLWVRRSQVRRARPHCDDILRLNARAMHAFTRYFAHPFPFEKYDLVAIPDFPYRGMEHAGATFLAEKDLFPPPGCGPVARFERAQLVFHETAHQWAGDLVTMRSFDDLWLKEGFANFMAYKLAARILSRADADVAFHLLKIQACQTDQSAGTTPLHQPLPDMALAKSAYGSIVYAKAPAVLRQLESLLGAKTFQIAVRAWVRRHAYGPSDWSDLVSALEHASGQSLQRWARAWLCSPGVPRLSAQLRSRPGGRTALSIRQAPMGPAQVKSWPLHLQVEITGVSDRPVSRRIDMEHVRVDVALPGKAAGKVVSLDPDDRIYAVVECETDDIDAIGKAIRRTRSPLRRIRMWESSWHSVRAGRLPPERYAMLALGSLGAEAHPMIVAAVAQRLQIALDRLGAGTRDAALPEHLDTFLLKQVRSAASGLEQVWIRALIALARTDAGLHALETTALDRRSAGASIAPAVRDEAAVMLVVRGAWSGANALRAVGDMTQKRAPLRMQIAAAQPGAGSKRQVFESWLDARDLPDAAIVASLDVFNHPAHAEATLPLLARALKNVPALYRRRKIFFVNRWISAFVGGQGSERAREVVLRSLARLNIEAPLRRKLVEAEYELSLAVDIRRRWSGGRQRN